MRLLLIQAMGPDRNELEDQLKKAGLAVVTASTGSESIDLAAQYRPGVILVSSALPDLSETQVCKLLKRDPRSAGSSIVVLSDKDAELDRVLAFELGADDYLVKPFSVRELLLRIKAILRRPRPISPPPRVDQFGGLRIDRDARRVWVEGRQIELTALEFDLLALLFDRRGRVLARSVLLREVWFYEGNPSTRTVDQNIKRLRNRLGPAGAYIETIRGIGYAFVSQPEAARGATSGKQS
jgi:two-component system phosphate regulon response regulator PhoB